MSAEKTNCSEPTLRSPRQLRLANGNLTLSAALEVGEHFRVHHTPPSEGSRPKTSRL